MRHFLSVLGLLVACSPAVALAVNPSAVDSVERIVWDKAPITVRLPVGQERWITFPQAVRIGVPETIRSSLRIQALPGTGTVYWAAREAFGTTRIQAETLESGEIVLLDVTAEKDKKVPATPIEIVRSKQQNSKAIESDSRKSVRPSDENHSAPGYVDLTRFAAQQVYAPRRLLKTLSGVTRMPVSDKPIPLVRGAPVTAMPLAAWRSAGHYVIAVKLRNRGRRPVVLDPRNFRGQWLTATLQHARLGPAGSDTEGSAAYLVSRRPLEQAFVPFRNRGEDGQSVAGRGSE